MNQYSFCLFEDAVQKLRYKIHSRIVVKLSASMGSTVNDLERHAIGQTGLFVGAV